MGSNVLDLQFYVINFHLKSFFFFEKITIVACADWLLLCLKRLFSKENKELQLSVLLRNA